MKIFPLSIFGKVVLIFIAIVLGLIYWMLAKPEFWKKRFRKKSKDEQG